MIVAAVLLLVGHAVLALAARTALIGAPSGQPLSWRRELGKRDELSQGGEIG